MVGERKCTTEENADGIGIKGGDVEVCTEVLVVASYAAHELD